MGEDYPEGRSCNLKYQTLVEKQMQKDLQILQEHNTVEQSFI